MNLVVAYDRQRGIGKDNDLPWKHDALPTDLRHFRSLTLGHAVIMGRKTYESIGRTLPERRNIVVSRNEKLARDANIEHATSLDQAMQLVENEAIVDIIGGGEIFRQALPFVDRIYATEVDTDFDCDVVFPTLDTNIWQETVRELGSRAADIYNFDFVTYERKTR